ncbi:hypothetical protein [Sphingobium lignivorans]|uniref:hypothetical protein n=1 Tax=Sphingobium lignivorans TaxID=2735886 RepID=UPI0030B8684B
MATRYDQLAESFLGMVHIANARYWLKIIHPAWVHNIIYSRPPRLIPRSRSSPDCGAGRRRCL